MAQQNLSALSLPELLSLAEKELQNARRNAGKAWAIVKRAQLQLARFR